MFELLLLVKILKFVIKFSGNEYVDNFVFKGLFVFILGEKFIIWEFGFIVNNMLLVCYV